MGALFASIRGFWDSNATTVFVTLLGVMGLLLFLERNHAQDLAQDLAEEQQTSERLERENTTLWETIQYRSTINQDIQQQTADLNAKFQELDKQLRNIDFNPVIVTPDIDLPEPVPSTPSGGEIMVLWEAYRTVQGGQYD